MWFLAFEKRFGYRGEFNHGDRLSERFFLSSALRKQHAFVIGAVCVVIDVSLIFSVGVLIQEIPLLITFAGYFGALCLFVYGLLAFKRALSFVGLDTQSVKKMTVLAAVSTTAALSLLNPHVYLDTVILLGSIGGQMPDN